MGKNLLVSFSGGETSAFMAQWLRYHAHEHGFDNLVYVFANTGLENEETLEFANECDKKWNLRLNWVEALVHHDERKGSTHRHTDYYLAHRNGYPFEETIKKYGIPNQAFPQCTRELKSNPIKSFGKEYFKGEEYWTAIGIRVDEADRMNKDHRKNRFVYPLISMIPFTKQKVNFFWKSQPFRLNLKGYQGNCTTCWKKSDPKLYTIAKENPKAFDFMREMEAKYPRVGPEFARDETCVNRVFFRGHRSVEDILSEAQEYDGKVRNDAIDYNIQTDLLENESCEVFSECGTDN